METTNFFSSVAALNITGDLQLTIRKGAESNWLVSVISQSIATAFLSPWAESRCAEKRCSHLPKAGSCPFSFPVIHFVQQAAALIIILVF